MNETDQNAKPDFSFPRERKLHGRSVFIELRTKGYRKRLSLIGICYLPATTPLQVGLAIGKRAGNAVVRNRTKRLLREYLRHHWISLPPTGKLLISAFRAIDPWNEKVSKQLRDLLATIPRN